MTTSHQLISYHRQELHYNLQPGYSIIDLRLLLSIVLHLAKRRLPSQVVSQSRIQLPHPPGPMKKILIHSQMILSFLLQFAQRTLVPLNQRLGRSHFD